MKRLAIEFWAWLRLAAGSTLVRLGVLVSGNGIYALGNQTGPLSKMKITLQYGARGDAFMMLALKDKIDRHFDSQRERLASQLNSEMKAIIDQTKARSG